VRFGVCPFLGMLFSSQLDLKIFPLEIFLTTNDDRPTTAYAFFARLVPYFDRP